MVTATTTTASDRCCSCRTILKCKSALHSLFDSNDNGGAAGKVTSAAATMVRWECAAAALSPGMASELAEKRALQTMETGDNEYVNELRSRNGFLDASGAVVN